MQGSANETACRGVGWNCFGPTCMLAIYASTVGNIGTGVFIGAGIGTIACVHFFARAQGNGWTSAYLHLWHGTALCVMDLSLLFILSQSLSRSRDSPSHIPTEFAYAPIVLSFIFVFPKVMEGSGPCQGQSLLLDRILFLLGACSFLFVCLYTPDMHGSSYPAGAWAIPLFCALVVLYAIPQDPSGGTQRAMDMVAAAKCMTLVIGILLFNRKDSGHNAIMYDYYSLRILVQEDPSADGHVHTTKLAAGILIRCYCILSVCRWMLEARSRGVQASCLHGYNERSVKVHMHELFLMYTLVCIQIALLSVSRVNTYTGGVRLSYSDIYEAHSMGILLGLLVLTILAFVPLAPYIRSKANTWDQ